VLQRHTVKELHRDEGSPIHLINLVNRADVRVVQRGRGFGFPLESAESLCVVGKIIGEELQCGVATQLQVFGFVDHAHTPTADPTEDAVVRDGLVDHAWRRDSGSNLRDDKKAKSTGGEQEEKLPKSVAPIVFLTLKVGGQKGLRRSSRKRVILLMQNFRIQ
jgi:hypothetical protein